MQAIADVRYRIAGPADAAAIARLHAESWRSTYRGFYSDSYLDHEVFADRAAVWGERFSEPIDPSHATLTIVAEENGELVGFAHSLVDDDPEWGTLLDNLHVRPDRKRSGIGRQLMAESAVRLQSNGLTLGLYLWVLKGNTDAHHFYDALGGRVTGRGTSSDGGSSAPSLRYWWPELGQLTRNLPTDATDASRRS